MEKRYTKRALGRFQSYIGPRSKSGCRVWRGYLDKDGYGRIRMDGIRIHAHRVACILHNGPPPSTDAIACHTCDNPWCVEGSHLVWGTHKDNHEDAIAKGRKRNGHRVPRKLTPHKVLLIRKASGTCIEIGRRFGVGGTIVSKIKRRTAWSHIDDAGKNVEEFDNITIAGK